MAGSTAKEEDRSENEQADDGEDLDRGKPELRLSIRVDREEVKCHNDGDHDPARQHQHVFL